MKFAESISVLMSGGESEQDFALQAIRDVCGVPEFDQDTLVVTRVDSRGYSVFWQLSGATVSGAAISHEYEVEHGGNDRVEVLQVR